MPVVEQNVEDGVEVQEAPKKVVKKVVKKAATVTKVVGGKGKIVKKAAKPKKEDSEAKERVGAVLQSEILSFMRKGNEYTSREIVEGLGRIPGNAEGQPVVNQLHKLAEEKKVKNVANEGKRGFSWSKN